MGLLLLLNSHIFSVYFTELLMTEGSQNEMSQWVLLKYHGPFYTVHSLVRTVNPSVYRKCMSQEHENEEGIFIIKHCNFLILQFDPNNFKK